MPIVKMPDGSTIKFPDDMPEKELSNAVMLYSIRMKPTEDSTQLENDRSGIMMRGPGESRELQLGGAAELAGGLIGGFAPTLRQRVPAAGILGAGGQGLYQLYQHLTDNPSAPKTSEEAATRMGIGGLTQGGGQLGGELLMKGVARALPHVKEQFMVPDRTGSEEALRGYMEPYLNKGLSERIMDKVRGVLPESLQWEQFEKPGFTIAQKSDPLSGAHRMEQLVESSFFGSKPIKSFKFAQQRGLEDWAKQASEEVWQGVSKLPPEQRGQAFVEAFDKAEGVFRQGAQAKYAQVDKVLGGEAIETTSKKTSSIVDAYGSPFTYDVTETSNKIVDLTPFKKWAAKEAKGNTQFAGYGSSQAGDNLISKASGLPDRMSFADAAELRSRLIKESSMAEGKDVARKMAAQGVSSIDSAMEQAAKTAGGDAEKVWREANSFYKEGKKTFDNDFMANLIKQGKEQPELVGKKLFQNGEITQIKMAKDVLKNDPKTFQSMKAGWLEDVLTNTKKADGSLVGNTFFRQLKGMGDDTLKEIFNGSELAMIRKFEEASTRTQKLGSAGGGSILIQLMQAGALGGAITGAWFKDPDIVAGGLAVLIAPKVMAHMIVNPKYHHLFYNGLSTERPVFVPALTKLAAEAIKVNNEISEKEQMRTEMRINK
jgi:hypothetical protein